MARIPGGTFKDWKDGQTVNANDYVQELEIIRTAINSTDDDVVILKNASAGTIKRVPSGIAFPTSPEPEIGDVFYRTDQGILYVLNASSQWEAVSPQAFGLGSTAKEIGDTDLNNLNETGFYKGGNLAHAPTSDTWFINHIDGGSLWKTQIGITYGVPRIYIRSLVNGVWEEWTRLFYAGPPNTIVPQSGWTGTMQYRKSYSGLVRLFLDITSGTTTGLTILGNIPTGYRPTKKIPISAIVPLTGTVVSDAFYLMEDGNIRVSANTTLNTATNYNAEIFFYDVDSL